MNKNAFLGISGVGLIGLLAINYEYQDFKKRNEYFPFPKVDIEVVKESSILPRINYSIDARTGEVETSLQERPDEYFVKIIASVDKKSNYIDEFFNRPKFENIKVYIKGKEDESIIAGVSNENMIRFDIREIPLNQDYKIYAIATYSNEEKRIVSTGVDESAGNIYKVK